MRQIDWCLHTHTSWEMERTEKKKNPRSQSLTKQRCHNNLIYVWDRSLRQTKQKIQKLQKLNRYRMLWRWFICAHTTQAFHIHTLKRTYWSSVSTSDVRTFDHLIRSGKAKNKIQFQFFLVFPLFRSSSLPLLRTFAMKWLYYCDTVHRNEHRTGRRSAFNITST